MLTIKIVEDGTASAKEMGVSLLPGAEVMEVRDGQLLMGIGVMRLFDNFAVIDDICMKEEFKEFTLEYGLGKSLLNVVDLRGIRFVFSDNENIEKQLRALKFKAPSELEDASQYPPEILPHRLCLCLDGYFLAKC